MNYNYIFYFLGYLLSFILFSLSILYVSQDTSSNVEVNLVNISDINIDFGILISNNELTFSFTVFLIFTSVYHFAIGYLHWDAQKQRLMSVMFLFVISMILLVCGSNFFTQFLGWDGLGITSLILITHFSSNASLKAGMYAFLMNRVGDCFFILVMTILACKFSSFSISLQNLLIQGSTSVIMLLMVFLAITKSAQIPFSTWLIKAMEAPTPVSSLVHSSTLVTAGVYLLFKYEDLWKSEWSMSLLMSLSISTLFIASICGMVSKDLKKIVAFSTLSQLGFVFFLFSMDLMKAGFFYLVIHAFFKALMFMSSGYVIHHSYGWQDIRKMSLNQNCSPTMVKIFGVSNMSLCGMPFLAGFYSKDLVLDKMMMTNYSFTLLVIMIISFVATVFYVLRLNWYVVYGTTACSSMSDEEHIMINSNILLYLLSCVMGSLMLWHSLPASPPLDSPKALLTLFLVMMGFVLWKSSFLNPSFFLKTMFYMNVIYNYLIKSYSKLTMTLLWFSDLMGIIGKFLKFSKFFSGYSDWLKKNNWSLLDLSSTSFLMISLYILWIWFF